jgi:hypothetical protein
MMDDTIDLPALERMTKDLREAAVTMSAQEARYLVDAYYLMQEGRKRADNQVRAMVGEPHQVLAWLAKQSDVLENQVKAALGKYANAQPVGAWMQANKGIGPVISAGLLAHIDITKAATVSDIWRFAGLDPTSIWEKNEKRPWNASLKTLCWKIGESFVKVSGSEDAYYGRIYAERKLSEVTNNDALAYANQAEKILATKRIGKSTDAYKAYITGKLPPAHIHARAKRYAAKRFLSDLHLVWHFIVYQKLPPFPYIITRDVHAHFQGPPHTDIVPGLHAALVARGPIS